MPNRGCQRTRILPGTTPPKITEKKAKLDQYFTEELPRTILIKTKHLASIDDAKVTIIHANSKYVYCGTLTGLIISFQIENEELKRISSYQAYKSEILQIDSDEQSKILFYRNSKGIGLLDFGTLEPKNEIDVNKTKLKNGFIKNKNVLFTLDQSYLTKRFAIFSNSDRVIIVYKYADEKGHLLQDFTIEAKIQTHVDIEELFLSCNLVLFYANKNPYVYNIKEDRTVECKFAIEKSRSDKVNIVYCNERQNVDDSYIIYISNENRMNPHFLEDKDRVVPIYIENQNKHYANKYCDMVFSGTPISSISFYPFIISLVPFEKKLRIEIKNIFNSRSTDTSKRDAFKSTRDPIPIILNGFTRVHFTCSKTDVYYVADEKIYRIIIPKPPIIKKMLLSDELTTHAKKYEEEMTKKSISCIEIEEKKQVILTREEEHEIIREIQRLLNKNPKYLTIEEKIYLDNLKEYLNKLEEHMKLHKTKPKYEFYTVARNLFKNFEELNTSEKEVIKFEKSTYDLEKIRSNRPTKEMELLIYEETEKIFKKKDRTKEEEEYLNQIEKLSKEIEGIEHGFGCNALFNEMTSPLFHIKSIYKKQSSDFENE